MVLQVGGADGLRWSDAHTVQWFAGFDVVYCQPEAGTDDQQVAFAGRLREALEILKGWSGRIVWIINEHMTQRVADSIGCGTLQSLPALPPGEVVTELGVLPQRSEPRFALRDLPHGWSPFARWQGADRVTEIVVGAISPDERWIATVSGLTPSDFFPPLEDLQRYLPVAWIAMLIAITVILAIHARTQALAAYDSGVKKIGEVNILQDLADRPTSGETAASRMLHRILVRQHSRLRSIASEARSAQSPVQIWEGSTGDHKGSAHFQLALASGDLDSAYRIAANAVRDSEDHTDWQKLLTETIWQRALESLLELDFVHAQMYTAMYVRLTDVHGRVATHREALEPERNRTLARILERELTSPRIYSLCSHPEGARQFGRLLGGDWGERLPATTPALTAARATNAAAQCRGKTVAAFDYASLRQLEEIKGSTDIRQLAVFQIAPIECQFLRLRAALLDYERALQEKTAGPSPMPDVLAFAASCSYLSDDLIGMLLSIARADTADNGLRIDAKGLDEALACVGANSDYAHIIRKSIDDFPCAVLTGASGASKSAYGSQVRERCRQ